MGAFLVPNESKSLLAILVDEWRDSRRKVQTLTYVIDPTTKSQTKLTMAIPKILGKNFGQAEKEFFRDPLTGAGYLAMHVQSNRTETYNIVVYDLSDQNKIAGLFGIGTSASEGFEWFSNPLDSQIYFVVKTVDGKKLFRFKRGEAKDPTDVTRVSKPLPIPSKEELMQVFWDDKHSTPFLLTKGKKGEVILRNLLQFRSPKAGGDRTPLLTISEDPWLVANDMWVAYLPIQNGQGGRLLSIGPNSKATFYDVSNDSQPKMVQTIDGPGITKQTRLFSHGPEQEPYLVSPFEKRDPLDPPLPSLNIQKIENSSQAIAVDGLETTKLEVVGALPSAPETPRLLIHDPRGKIHIVDINTVLNQSR